MSYMTQLRMPLLLVFLFFLSSILAACPPTPATKWSQLGLASGPTVNITLTQDVLLDQNITVNNLTIADGKKLVVDQTKDVKIRARLIYVNVGAEFWIGGEGCAYTKTAEIIFTGPWTSTASQGLGDKGMIVYGKVEWHGVQTNPTWTSLNKTAEIGDKSITLAVSVPWKVGAQIVIASTDYDEYQSEVVTITAVSGNVVSFSEPLKYMHWGEPLQYVDERAEVGLLTKNIKVSGEPDPNDPNTIKGPRFGGHTLYVQNSTAHVDNVQFSAMGQAGLLARYPVHFHAAENMLGSYVKQCAFLNTFQRCLTIHATHNVVVEDNVAYNSSGHCYFFEDGYEQGNTANRNLGVIANNVPDANLRVIPSDNTQASVFWITHANNTITNNVAVGGIFGFWYAFPEHPTGFTATMAKHTGDTWPRYQRMGTFRGNKAHSTNSGLFVDNGPAANGDTSQQTSYNCRTFDLDKVWANSLTPAQLDSLEAVLVDSPRTIPARFEEFTAHHCQDNAGWLRGDNMIIDGFYSSNSRLALTTPGGPNLIQNVIIVGDTKNPGNPSNKASMQGRSRMLTYNVSYPMLGLQHYDCCGPNFVRNALFVNFTDFNFVFTGETRKTGAVTFQNGEHPIPPNTRFWNVKFEKVTNRVYYSPDAAFRTALKYAFLVDGDGSFTGSCGSVIAPNNQLLLRPACQAVPSWNGYSCPPNTISPRYIEASEALGTDFITPASTSADVPGNPQVNLTAVSSGVGKAAIIRIDDRKANWINGVQTTTNTSHIWYEQNYRQNLPTQTEYLFLFPEQYGTPSRLRLQTYNMPTNEYFRIVVPYPIGTTFVPRNQSTYINIPAINCNDNILHPEWGQCGFKAVNSKAELVPQSYYWDNTRGLLWIHLQPPAQSFASSFNYTWPDASPGAYITATCPSNNCTVSKQALNNILTFTNVFWTSPTPYTAPSTNLCYTNGYENKGTKVYTELGTPLVLFDNNITNNWQLSTWSYANRSIQSAIAVSGFALEVKLNAWGQFQIRTNWNVEYALSSITPPGVAGQELALIFDIRVAPTPTPLNSLTLQRRDALKIIATIWESDLTGSQKRSWTVPVNSPEIIQGPVDSTKWYHVVVPWSQFMTGGIPSDLTKIMGIGIGISEGFPATLYADNIKIQYITSAYTAQSMPTFRNLALNTLDPMSPLVPADSTVSACKL